MLYWYGLGFVLLLIASCEYYTFKTGVPTVTSLPSARRKMIACLCEIAAAREETTPFKIVDLGSGTGKLSLEIGRALPQAEVVGIEISLVPFLLSLARRILWRAKNVRFVREDFWGRDLSDVGAVVVYMNGAIREKMAEKLKKALPEGAWVISNETHLPGWTPLATHKVGLLKLEIVLYKQGETA